MDLGGKSFRRVHCSIPVKVTLSNSAVGSPFHPPFSPLRCFFPRHSILISPRFFLFFFFFPTNFITLFPSLSFSHFFFSISSVSPGLNCIIFRPPLPHSRFIRDERINFLRKSRNLVFFKRTVKEISIQWMALKSYRGYCSWSRYTLALSTREF